MLASKDMACILSRDRKLIELMVDKHCIMRPAPSLVVPCDWCSQSGCECAKCFTWDHNGYAELNATPRITNPKRRLYKFCANCTKRLPKSVFDGRCLCNTKNLRSMCCNCRNKERSKLIEAGFKSWFETKKWRPRPGQTKKEPDECAIGRGLPAFQCESEVVESTKKLCDGVGGDGYACENEVGGFGEVVAEKGLGKKREGALTVTCCTWCGLAAVDAPVELPLCPLGSVASDG